MGFPHLAGIERHPKVPGISDDNESKEEPLHALVYVRDERSFGFLRCVRLCCYPLFYSSLSAFVLSLNLLCGFFFKQRAPLVKFNLKNATYIFFTITKAK